MRRKQLQKGNREPEKHNKPCPQSESNVSLFQPCKFIWVYLYSPAFVSDAFAAFILDLEINIRLIMKQAYGERGLTEIMATGRKVLAVEEADLEGWSDTHTYQHIRKDCSLVGDNPQPVSSCPWWATHQARQTMLDSSNTSQTCFKHFSSASFLLMLIAWKLFFDLCNRFVSASQNSDSETTDVPES